MILTSKTGCRILLAVVVCGLSTTKALFAADAKTATELSATVSSFVAPDGETYFAFVLKGEEAKVSEKVARDHVVLVDTSASQTGEHRVQAFAIVKAFLNELPTGDRVCLFAVDVSAQRLTEGFVTPRGDAVTQAIAALEKRVPAGATNMLAALNAGLDAFEKMRSGSILYVGDGMSTANLIQSSQLKTLTGDLQSRRIPVHSYAVGPRTDLQLLGTLAENTGGVVLFDKGSEQEELPTVVGKKLATFATTAVFYPENMRLFFSNAELYPNIALPVRSDRETIYLGKGKIDAKAVLSLAGRETGNDLAFTWRVAAVEASPENAFLAALWNRASQDKGVSIPFAGLEILHAAKNEFNQRIDQMVVVGEQAVATGNLDEAEQVALEIQRVDPGNIRAKTILSAANKLQTELLAQVEVADDAKDDQPKTATQPAKADKTDSETPQSEASKKEPQLPKSKSLLNDPNLAEKIDGRGAQQDDLIQKVKELQLIREQQMQLQVSRMIEQARAIATDDPQAARAILKRALGTVSAVTDINPEIRQQLTKRISSVMADIQSREESDLKRSTAAAESQAQLEAQKRLIEQMQLEDEKLEQLVDRVRALLEEARRGNDVAYQEAEAVADAAVDLRPGNAPATAARAVSEASGQLNTAFRLRALRGNQFLATLEQVERSHIPFPDEPPVVWPAPEVWKALTERRRKWASVDLHATSPAEERISAALEDQTEVEFIDTPLKDAMDFIADQHNITIVLNKAALAEESIAEDEPINQILSGITLRSALRIILGEYELTYITEDEVMKITTALDAETRLFTRVYPVGDLVIPPRTPRGGMGGGGMGGGMGGGRGGGMGGGGRGGGGGGGGFFSVAPPKLPNRPNPVINKRQPIKQAPARKIVDPEVQNILNDILGAKTGQASQSNGQAFAQVRDTLPKKSSRFDNETIKSLKKKRESNH